MMARKPEECDLHLIEAMNRGDLDAAVALYEPTATLVQDPSGEVVTGRAAIRDVIASYLALNLHMTRETSALQNADGNLAMTGGRWESTGTDPEGAPIVVRGNSREVVRRQMDGTWLFAIDNPWGGGLE